MFFKKETFKMRLEYQIRPDYIAFFSSGFEPDFEISSLFNDFLLDISKEHNVFFHAYRLSPTDALKIIDPAVILAKAEVLLDPFNTFFHLSEAKVSVEFFDMACEATIYFFENNVEWPSFLASPVILKTQELINNRLLSAHFTMGDHGTQFWFEGNRQYEKRVLQLIESLSKLGCKIQQSLKLPFQH